MSSVAYVRQYTVESGVAQVQDFYYPSMKKYSDPYEIPAAQIKTFVPVLNNGTLTLWHFNGQKKMIGSYRNGKPNGEWTNWYPNGKKSAVMPYLNGLSEGVGSRYYRNGTKESEIQFKHDKANGYWKQWYPNGSPKTEMTMVNDKPTRNHELGRKRPRPFLKLPLPTANATALFWNGMTTEPKSPKRFTPTTKIVKKTNWDKEGSFIE